jgi:hypothetical protein
MVALIVTCRGCHRGYAPSREDLVLGPQHYYRCPACRIGEPPNQEHTAPPATCEACGRPLWHPDRSLCIGCLGGSAA